jgi:peptide/nickel transport system ATP-binding protein
MAGSGTAHLRENSILRVENLVMEFPVKGTRQRVQAVSNISFDVADGETLGLVGESGCGKSTTGKAIMQLPAPTSGSVTFDGTNLTALKGEALRATRPKLQMIFQDPISSLNPRRTITQIVGEPLKIWKRGSDSERSAKVDEVLEAVGVDPAAAASRRPHEFSGGQCQRISIARAVVTDPKLIICDEPVSALDVSVQAQVLNLLEDMKARYGLTMVFIAHDLAVVKNISDRIAVMYLGKMCEIGTPDSLFARPAHPYTRALISAIPHPDPNVPLDHTWRLEGDLPSPLNPPTGCRFRTRCPMAQDICTTVEPQMTKVGDGAPGHYVACHFPLAETPVEFAAIQAAGV